MPHPILHPQHLDPSRRGRCALAIMAKAPPPRKVKTRLAPPLTLDQSAALNICFLQDTAANLASIPGADVLLCYTPLGDEALFDGLLPPQTALIPQRGDTFGERLLLAATDILACGYSSVCLIDSDSPTVPAAAFQQAVQALAQPGDRLVLGPSHDGGYYLIGLTHPHPAPFTDITWSTPSVYAETLAGARNAHLEVIELPLWYDVDDGATLHLLRAELLHAAPPPFTSRPGYPAPHSRAFLQALAPEADA